MRYEIRPLGTWTGPATEGDERCCGDPQCGWPDVADRMDRWAADGYRGHWLDPAYDPPGGIDE